MDLVENLGSIWDSDDWLRHVLHYNIRGLDAGDVLDRMAGHLENTMVLEQLTYEPPGGLGRFATYTGALIDYEKGLIDSCSVDSKGAA
jgi:hypothetical protein